MWGRNTSLDVGHGAAGWARGRVITHVGAQSPAGPWQVGQSEQEPSCQRSTWHWKGGGYHWCVCAHACMHMWVKIEIFGQKSLCSWKKTSCWVILGYVSLDGVLLVLLLPHLNSTLASSAALQTQEIVTGTALCSLLYNTRHLTTSTVLSWMVNKGFFL